MEEWKEGFKNIYGRSPTPGDIEIAPTNLKNLLKTEIPVEKKDENIKKRGTKRKQFEMKMNDCEEFSPIKKKTNPKKLKIDENFDCHQVGLRTSPRKRLVNNKINFSPKKNHLTLEESPIKTNMFSPKKGAQTPKSGRKVFLDDVSPIKCVESNRKCSKILTPIKSPLKKIYQKQLAERKDINFLLMPTPEKQEEIEEHFEEFNDETTAEVAKARKSIVRKNLGTTKKSDQNFQKINLKKKQFVRGKITAEQKRKLKRKQMFKKKF